MHFLLHNMGFYPCEELSFHSLTLYLIGYIPSGRCPARSRRTPHSWRGRRRQKPRERRKHRMLGASSYVATPRMRGGAPQAGFRPRDQGEVRSRGKAELENREASRQPRRKKNRHYEEEQAGGDPDLRSRAGLEGGAPRAVHHTLPILSLATSPPLVQPSSFPRSREMSLCWIPVVRRAS